MLVKLTEEEYDTCSKFASDVVETNKDCYARRNQTDVPKIIDDIKVGKLAEVACKKLLIARGMTITTDVDFAVYGKKKKFRKRLEQVASVYRGASKCRMI